MGYRKITVDDTTYEYVVGRTHVKIRGIGALPKDEVGHREVEDCGCGGDTGCPYWRYVLRVGPGDIKASLMRFKNRAK